MPIFLKEKGRMNTSKKFDNDKPCEKRSCIHTYKKSATIDKRQTIFTI
jgi:hypothetical protein